MMDELINKMDEASNTTYKLVDKKTGKVVFTGKYNQVVQKDKETGYKHKVVSEDAPANAVAHGGVDMNPTGRKPKDKDKYKDTNKDVTDVLRRTIMKKMGNNVKENFDNNNVVLRGINETLNKLEDKIDEKNGIEKEEVKLEKKQTFHDKFVKDLQDNTPHAGQFDEDI